MRLKIVRRFGLVLALLGCVAASALAQEGPTNCPKSGQPGEYSKIAIELCFQNFDKGLRDLDLVSPNGLIHFVVHGDTGWIYSHGQRIGGKFDVYTDEEVIWSPDSKAMIDTLSFGAMGPTTAGAGYVEKSSETVAAETPVIMADFAARHRGIECADSADVGGLGWLKGSKEALFVGEIPPAPNCGEDWGYFDVYVLSFPGGKILHVYPMAEALKRFRSLLGPGMRRDVPTLVKRPRPDSHR